MKNKPLRHKEKNRFQFKPFSERINEIDVDVFHRVTHRNEDFENDEVETYFYQTLKKWNVLNLTQGYCDFKKKVHTIVTLPQLLNQKQYVVDMLKEYLKMKNTLFLQPILELTIALARDLQKDFYPYFPEFLTIIIDLLQTKDTEQIEYSFTTLAYLFKFLWRYLIRNVPTVFKLLLPLLADTQPLYINNFAAESFAFVVRKIKDKTSFIKLVLQVLKETPNGIPGCGKLLFEVIYGTSGHFHSCAEDMLLLYFKSMQDDTVDQTLLFDVLTKVIECILLNIHPQKSELFWKVLLNVIDLFAKNDTNEGELPRNKATNLILIMQHVHSVIIFKDGRILIDPNPLVKKLVFLFNLYENDSSTLKEILNVFADILLASNVKLMQETSSQLLMKIMSVSYTDLKYLTIERLINYSSFDTIVLPTLIKSTALTSFDSTLLKLYAKIVRSKTHTCLTGIKLKQWKRLKLDLDIESDSNINYFLQTLKTLLTSEVSEDALHILLIYPHLKTIPISVLNTVKEGFLSLYDRMLNHEMSDDEIIINNIGKLSFVFLLVLESMIHSLQPNILYDFITQSNINILDVVKKHRDNICVLSAVDLFLTYFQASQFEDKFITMEVFNAMSSEIKHNLGLPTQQNRLISAHIYSLFCDMKDLVGITNDNKNPLEIMFFAECEKATVHTYRNRLLHLQSLSFQTSAISSLNPNYYEIPLRYLIGNLYINFSLLWDPVIKIISTYANTTFSQFWTVFNEILNTEKPSNVAQQIFSFKYDIISELEIELYKNDESPDYENFKILLWKCMAEFPSLCESKNRDLTGLFIDHVNNHFFKSNSEDAKSCNILKYKNEDNKEDLKDIDKQSDDDDATDEDKLIISENNRDIKIVFSKNFKTKLLLGQMEIFAKMNNPRTLYREPEIQKIYYDLLLSRNTDIQKAALNCLLTYKYKYLTPYKEQLNSLINEKNLKNELTRFRIDEESNMIKTEHRSDLMPILLRIIYAKMTRKTGMRTGGKAGGILRRKLILRFLAGVQEDEMIMFINMAFRPLRKYVTASEINLQLSVQVREIMNNVDLTNVIPPKRMQSAVNLLGIIMEQFGAKMDKNLLPNLLRMLLCILSEITGILKESHQIHSGYLHIIKNVRTHCIIIFGRIFSQFENYNWTEDEINALFDVAVFPWLEKLPIEGIHSPTALLKLFAVWCTNPRYYPLLIKHHESNQCITPLPFIIKLLLTGKTHLSVINTIIGMLEQLLTLQDYGKQNEANSMEIDVPYLPMSSFSNLLSVSHELNNINYGSAILIPHVADILLYMKNKLNRSSKGVNKSETIILSRISEFIKNAEICDTLLTLLLPILNRKTSCGESDDIIIEMLTTIGNLIKNVDKPEIHIRSVNPLLGLMSAVDARKHVIQLYSTIASGSTEEHRETMLKNSEILIELNAWDSKWIDQPDFQKRLDAFTKINELLEANMLTLDFGVAIIYNCFFFIKNESDLALKDCSGQCLKSIGPKLAIMHKDNVQNRRYLLDDTILTIIRKGIISKNETVRLQSIAFMGTMSMECPETHPIFRDLSVLTNKVDPEVDFFENMQHLQLHRKARALLKFCSIAKTLKKPPNPKTLTQFILPLASSYLCNESFIHKNSIIDAAIETIGVVCKLLPWYHYELTLKYYLAKLRTSVDYQKQMVRLLVAILDSFHFDISKFKTSEDIAKRTNELSNESDNKTLGSTERTDEEKPTVNEKERDDANAEDANAEDANAEDANAEDAEEHFNEELIKDDVEFTGEVEEGSAEVKSEDVAAIEKQIVMTQQGAQRIVNSIVQTLLPQLHRSITAKTRYDHSHKINKKKIASETEEEDLMRVPIALALVKLLQKLPKYLLDANLPGIFMKICNFLKSRLESVRRTTREILQNIMVTLGPEYLHHLLAEMNTLLTKGFQVHVLAFTVHSVLISLKPYFKPGHMNDNLQSILSVCKVDLFGLSAEEKEVIGFVKNVSEAKATKSYGIFQIMAEFITESCLLDLILPLKNVLVKTHSHKTVTKVVECLRNVVLGLADNQFIPLNQMLIFLYGVVSESIPDLLPEKKSKKLSEKEAEILNRQKPDCYIIQPEPKSRMGIKTLAKTTKGANAHVIVEFGLKLFHVLLKREKFPIAQYASYLEPFVSILNDCLKSQHVKLSTLTLQCLNWALKMDLESVQTLVPEICNSLFAILHKYAAAGLSKGDNFDLVMAAFKCMSVLVRDVKHFIISAEQLKMLVFYAEQDLHDSDKQATAFALLKAIISRKLVIPEMHPVLEKVAALSVTSELEHVRVQSRSLFYMYLMEYPLGKHLNKHVAFYLSQLSYEMQPGRLSAHQMIHSMITGFPIKILINQSGVIFIMASARLVNDEDPTCRKICAKSIKEMIIRLPQKDKKKLFEIVIEWLKDQKVAHRTLAAQLCGIFVTIEKDNFESYLKELLPLLIKQFYPEDDGNNTSGAGRFVKLSKSDSLKDNQFKNIKDPERMKDHHLFQILQLLLKISTYCNPFLKGDQYNSSIKSFAEYAQVLLGYPHLWVRLAAAQLIGLFMGTIDVEQTAKILSNTEGIKIEADSIYTNPEEIRSLTLDLVAQLYPDMVFEELTDQVVKNLIFISKILNVVKVVHIENAEMDDNKEAKNTSLSVAWVFRRLRKSLNTEITQSPKSTSVRTAVFKWIAGLVVTLPLEDLQPILFNIMSPLVRELSTTEEFNASSRRLAKEVAGLIKKQMGSEAYVRLLSNVQQKLDIKKAERKKVRAQQFVTDPELAAKRKIAKQQKKKEAKKRMRETMKGKRKPWKKQKKDIDEI
ncbi:small subunit processome component 20 homolog [Prorops nasuta]|uniref:small subunit processome component 20 homolog n=1 Tax=Prorops nasuta TaxID=863751 RepID=UPI0034CFDCC6